MKLKKFSGRQMAAAEALAKGLTVYESSEESGIALGHLVNLLDRDEEFRDLIGSFKSKTVERIRWKLNALLEKTLDIYARIIDEKEETPETRHQISVAESAVKLYLKTKISEKLELPVPEQRQIETAAEIIDAKFTSVSSKDLHRALETGTPPKNRNEGQAAEKSAQSRKRKASQKKSGKASTGSSGSEEISATS